MLIFHLFRNASLTLKRQYLCQYRRKIECYISKSKLILCEWNAFYFSEIAFIDFTLHKIKQCIVFFLGHPVDISFRSFAIALKEVFWIDNNNYKAFSVAKPHSNSKIVLL